MKMSRIAVALVFGVGVFVGVLFGTGQLQVVEPVNAQTEPEAVSPTKARDRDGSVSVSTETADVVLAALQLAEATEGALQKFEQQEQQLFAFESHQTSSKQQHLL